MTSLLSLLVLLFKHNSALQAPCDIFEYNETPCVAAHSTVRALYSEYDGMLYEVQRQSDNKTLDIGVKSASGFADAASQDAFCKGTNCVVTGIYDQSPQQNHLYRAPAGGAHHAADNLVNASRLSLTVGGNAVYAAYFEGGMGYRVDNVYGVATGNEPETIYMVTSGKHYNGGCCFDYGNAETDNNDDGKSTMEALYFGSSTGWGRGNGNGPWIMADLENGLWAGNERVNDKNIPITTDYVFAMLKGGENGFALKGADANGKSPSTLQKFFDGPRPAGYQPMHKQGAIILGIGGDNSDRAIGTFFEGAMTYGYTTDATDEAVFQNVVAAKYGM